KKLPAPDKLADLLTFHSFEVEEVKKQGPASSAGKKDWVLDIDVLPNRAHDCLSHQGIVREISVLLKYPFELIDYSKKIKENSKSINDLIKIEVKDSNLCPRYMARAIIDVKVGPSPKWIQERLKVCGLKSINNIVDIANYVMLETGQPLHAFDADKIDQKTLIIRSAKKEEKIITLEKERFDLDKNILVIADTEKPVCIAGIKGGQGPEIDSKTTKVILEAANFNPLIIRKASQQLKLRTDASWRFENELDPNLTEEINMAAYLIQEIAKGKILKGTIDIYPKKVYPKKIGLDMDKVDSLLGVKIPEKEIKSILTRLGFELKGTKKLQVTIPTRRLDVSIPEDLIEEVGRIYGFEKIPSQLPDAALIPPEKNEDLIYQNKVKDILTNLGFSEVYNYSLIGQKEVDSDQNKSNLIELLNPISQEQKYMRPSLMPLLIKNVMENKKYFDEVRLFEIGRVFQKNKNKVIEKKKLGLVLFPSNFYRLKGIIETLLNKLRISNVWYNDKSGKDIRAEVKAGNDLLGWVNDDGFEIDFEKLVELATEERMYLPPSKYPSMIRDISLLVDQGTKVVEVLNLINAAGGPLVIDVELFDMYEGKEVMDNMKSLAFHIIYQSNDHTLTDKEVNKLQDKIIKTLEEEGGWEVRK
ncbi:MAG: phenylalanine--tRNA ligase subunit beta, partial [Patescibacteria group bacterium]